MVAHACNPALRRLRQDDHEFERQPGCIVRPPSQEKKLKERFKIYFV
jgi:hypothetical protein